MVESTYRMLTYICPLTVLAAVAATFVLHAAGRVALRPEITRLSIGGQSALYPH
ncbi:MAG: hypothetical protein JO020_24585 [Chloroflexi bacterium]|nr:hypothetical protein [Chloroflexota bacterium]MBV9131060.1 hypothetical protein [Chloroflexota bacterium]MBV9897349.1 hypothetical protein [Chloroflexota bacterium]